MPVEPCARIRPLDDGAERSSGGQAAGPGSAARRAAAPLFNCWSGATCAASPTALFRATRKSRPASAGRRPPAPSRGPAPRTVSRCSFRATAWCGEQETSRAIAGASRASASCWSESGRRSTARGRSAHDRPTRLARAHARCAWSQGCPKLMPGLSRRQAKYARSRPGCRRDRRGARCGGAPGTRRCRR